MRLTYELTLVFKHLLQLFRIYKYNACITYSVVQYAGEKKLELNCSSKARTVTYCFDFYQTIGQSFNFRMMLLISMF